jgi:hypothetical protein
MNRSRNPSPPPAELFWRFAECPITGKLCIKLENFSLAQLVTLEEWAEDEIVTEFAAKQGTSAFWAMTPEDSILEVRVYRPVVQRSVGETWNI